jgi:7-carboxy-7-deazaguanine synthase
MGATLRISEIFYSLQGESASVGYPTVFVRLTGCPLRCQYCDTAYAFSGGVIYQLDQILREVQQYNTRHITVTGGEPLAQPACLPLLSLLCDEGYEVSLETSGALDMRGVDSRVIKVMDIKTPGSLEESKNLPENLDYLGPRDQVKFVICSHDDYLWSCEKVVQTQLSAKVSDVFFSPSTPDISPRDLAEWILEDQLDVRMQVQLHKILWGNEPGH